MESASLKAKASQTALASLWEMEPRLALAKALAQQVSKLD
jgi:hypothetical protein